MRNLSNINPAISLASNDVYEEHYQADLKNLSISLENDTIKVTKKPVPFIQKKEQNVNERNLNKILANESYVRDLKDMIKNGKTPIAIGVAKARFTKTLDENGNIISMRPMTNKEVAKEKYSNAVFAQDGEVQYNGDLSLFTSLSGSGPDYWIQSNAYWYPGESSSGNEALGITWESAFGANNNSGTTIVYDLSTETASLSKIEPYSGAVWNFPSGGIPSSLHGAYTGISIRLVGNTGRHYFTSEYIHTYSSNTYTYSVAAGASSTGATITVSPTTNQWKLVSYLQYDF